MNEQTTSVTLLSVTSSISIYTALLPPLSDVRKARGNQDVTNDVRMGELAATALTVAIGVSASAMVDSPIPGMVSVLAALTLVVMYETVLSATPKEVI